MRKNIKNNSCEPGNIKVDSIITYDGVFKEVEVWCKSLNIRVPTMDFIKSIVWQYYLDFNNELKEADVDVDDYIKNLCTQMAKYWTLILLASSSMDTPINLIEIL